MLNVSGQHRRAFSLLELIAAVAVLSILAAAIVPGTVAYLARARVEKAATILTNLQAAIVRFKVNPDAAGISNFPGRLSHLTRPILTTDPTSCTGIGSATPLTNYGTNNTHWTNNVYEGPYYYRTIPSSGLPIGIGTASDTVFRTTPSGTAGFLQIWVRNVSFEDAGELNDFIDGTAEADQPDRSNTTGRVQWTTPTSDDYVILKWTFAFAPGTC